MAVALETKVVGQLSRGATLDVAHDENGVLCGGQGFTSSHCVAFEKNRRPLFNTTKRKQARMPSSVLLFKRSLWVLKEVLRLEKSTPCGALLALTAVCLRKTTDEDDNEVTVNV